MTGLLNSVDAEGLFSDARLSLVSSVLCRPAGCSDGGKLSKIDFGYFSFSVLQRPIISTTDSCTKKKRSNVFLFSSIESQFC